MAALARNISNTADIRSAFDFSSRPVDLVHLAKQTLGDRSLEREVLKLFVSQVALYAKRIVKPSCSEDAVNALHTIKGSARNIGAWQVARVAEAIEPNCTALSAEQKAEFDAAIGEACGYIEDILSEE